MKTTHIAGDKDYKLVIQNWDGSSQTYFSTNYYELHQYSITLMHDENVEHVYIICASDKDAA